MIGKLKDLSTYNTLLRHAADDVCLAVYEYSFITAGCRVKAAREILEEGMVEWWDTSQKNPPPSLDYKDEYLALVQWCLVKIMDGRLTEISSIPSPRKK